MRVTGPPAAATTPTPAWKSFCERNAILPPAKSGTFSAGVKRAISKASQRSSGDQAGHSSASIDNEMRDGISVRPSY